VQEIASVTASARRAVYLSLPCKVLFVGERESVPRKNCGVATGDGIDQGLLVNVCVFQYWHDNTKWGTNRPAAEESLSVRLYTAKLDGR